MALFAFELLRVRFCELFCKIEKLGNGIENAAVPAKTEGEEKSVPTTDGKTILTPYS